MKHGLDNLTLLILMSGILTLFPSISPATENGNGTNQSANVLATNSITLRDATITSWQGLTNQNLLGAIFIRSDTAVTNVAAGVVTSSNIAAGAVTSNNINWAQMPSGLADGTVASNWARFPALQNVNMAGYSLTNSPQAERWDNAVITREGGGTIAFSNLYYFNASGYWTLANASTTNTAGGMLGLAMGSSVTNDGLLLNGYCTNDWGFATGSTIYMATNNGALTTSRPSGTNQIVRIVGYAVSATKIYFNPDRTFIKTAGY